MGGRTALGGSKKKREPRPEGGARAVTGNFIAAARRRYGKLKSAGDRVEGAAQIRPDSSNHGHRGDGD